MRLHPMYTDNRSSPTAAGNLPLTDPTSPRAWGLLLLGTAATGSRAHSSAVVLVAFVGDNFLARLPQATLISYLDHARPPSGLLFLRLSGLGLAHPT
jgi:hypothetical protein